MKKILLSLVIIAVASFAFGQNLSVFMNDGPRGGLHKVADEDNYRMAFRISGLATDQAVKQFIDKCKSYPGIADVQVKEMDKSGQRSAIIFVNEKKETDYFKGFLTHAGISKIFMNNKEYTPQTLEMLKQDRANNKNIDKKSNNK